MAQAKSVVTAIRTLMASPRKPLSTCAAREAHMLYVAAIAANPPPTIHEEAVSEDISKVASNIDGELVAFGLYLTARLDDLAQKTGQRIFSVDLEGVATLYRLLTEKAVLGVRETARVMAEVEDNLEAEAEEWRAA